MNLSSLLNLPSQGRGFANVAGVAVATEPPQSPFSPSAPQHKSQHQQQQEHVSLRPSPSATSQQSTRPAAVPRRVFPLSLRYTAT
jgi:hypothetical protein